MIAGSAQPKIEEPNTPPEDPVPKTQASVWNRASLRSNGLGKNSSPNASHTPAHEREVNVGRASPIPTADAGPHTLNSQQSVRKSALDDVASSEKPGEKEQEHTLGIAVKMSEEDRAAAEEQLKAQDAVVEKIAAENAVVENAGIENAGIENAENESAGAQNAENENTGAENPEVEKEETNGEKEGDEENGEAENLEAKEDELQKIRGLGGRRGKRSPTTPTSPQDDNNAGNNNGRSSKKKGKKGGNR
jgi:hypothetical protein